jgi:MoxR-like ATPase
VDLRRIQDGIREQVVGREEEAQLLLAALGAGRDLLLEGPPGTSKSTLLRAVTALNGTSLRFIEGNADLRSSAARDAGGGLLYIESSTASLRTH